MTGRDDDRFGRDLVAVGEVHESFVAPTLQADGGLGEHQVRAEHPGLLAGPTGELMSADAVREARIVADHRAASGLAAGHGLFQHDRPEAFGCGVDGGGQTGRPRSDDDDIACVDVVVDGPADRFDDLSRRRFDHRVVVVANHDRQPCCVQHPCSRAGGDPARCPRCGSGTAR